MKKKNSLAIFGGSKSFNYKSEHYIWPPKNKQRYIEVKKYLRKNKLNAVGYPDIVKKFEDKFRKRINMKYALSTNSGTSALHASFFAINLKKGDEVIVPSITFYATATPLLKFDVRLKFCGCDLNTGNICISDLKKKLSKKTKAVVVTHLCGHPCEMNEIMKLKKKYSFTLIEDCSHAHESTYKGKKVGTFGDIGVFSMDRNKLLSVGEGGVMVTNNKNLFERALLITDFGPRLESQITLRKNKKFIETGLGFKHRMHPLAAAIAFNELDNLKKYIKLRHKKLNYLSKGLSKIIGLKPPATKKYVNRGAFYSYRLFFDKTKFKKLNIDFFIKALKAEGINVRRSGNKPLHLLPYFKQQNKILKIISAEKYYNSTISLPTFTFDSYSIVNGYLKAFKKVCNYFCV